MMFDDRLEIHSPGKLPNIVTVENIKHERFSRNPRIARTLTEFGWVREMNEGVKRIYSEMESYFLHEPKYTEPGNKVVLTFGIDRVFKGFVPGRVIIGILFAIFVIIIGLKNGYYVICRVMLSNF